MKIEFNEDLLEHNIVEVDGLRILAPILLADDIAHDIYHDWKDDDEDVPANFVYDMCHDKLEDIVYEMFYQIKNVLEENDVYIT